MPSLDEPEDAIRRGEVQVDGRINRNPASVVGRGSTVSLTAPPVLRGEAKLTAALHAFRLDPEGRTCLDIGAAAGGFSTVLLAAGARRVYAVDAGHGQLLGTLRQNPRVVNLEATNLGDLNQSLVPEPIDLFTLDLSYLSLTAAVPQLDVLEIGPDAEMVALVKPMFELHLSTPPSDRERLEEALRVAQSGIEIAGWAVVDSMESPVTGSRGAVEFLVHARRATGSVWGGKSDDHASVD
jgi:23S rRNA (cytidine1920-2'-O)/16S rRNA (cytidine1409-2'-O)-methyltransferase